MTLKKFFPPRSNEHSVGAHVWYSYICQYQRRRLFARARVERLEGAFVRCMDIRPGWHENLFRRAFYNVVSCDTHVAVDARGIRSAPFVALVEKTAFVSETDEEESDGESESEYGCEFGSDCDLSHCEEHNPLRFGEEYDDVRQTSDDEWAHAVIDARWGAVRR